MVSIQSQYWKSSMVLNIDNTPSRSHRINNPSSRFHPAPLLFHFHRLTCFGDSPPLRDFPVGVASTPTTTIITPKRLSPLLPLELLNYRFLSVNPVLFLVLFKSPTYPITFLVVFLPLSHFTQSLPLRTLHAVIPPASPSLLFIRVVFFHISPRPFFHVADTCVLVD